ncbi:MAG: DUF2948 family protein [Hoeflea sp.]|uniref:DUF2948 family protein n=1 Tax=Hoeflea sp. TaxID=1940281 RepID=UPI002731BE4A|nr:DUF2948 family protein [Hoeflea sp.]MDP2119353.1 DUF2948 family protein [Hoeflea sp.]MDP3524893.1 DUF2948 family protein [Hoeflea sp.]MDZ7603737.1 DUF2948 family protein [Hoeflea sp.]
MDSLKLIALDETDLAVISACLQDAVFKTGDTAFLGRDKTFTLEGNRFVWEEGSDRKTFERRRAVLAVKQVQTVKSRGIDLRDTSAVHALLAVTFVAGDEAPAGAIELILSGDAAIRLEVDCIEIQFADVGGGWETKFKPHHPVAG